MFSKQKKKKSYQFYDVWLFRYYSAFCNDFYLSNRYLALQTLFNSHNSRHFSQSFKNTSKMSHLNIFKEVFSSETRTSACNEFVNGQFWLNLNHDTVESDKLFYFLYLHGYHFKLCFFPLINVRRPIMAKLKV